jgi:hypothetical protein
LAEALVDVEALADLDELSAAACTPAQAKVSTAPKLNNQKRIAHNLLSN